MFAQARAVDQPQASQDPVRAGTAAERLADLFHLHQLDLVRLAVLLVHDQATAEDVVQEVFLRLSARQGRYGRNGEELTYIRVCVLNACRSVLRRRTVARRVGESGDRSVGWQFEISASAETEVIKAEERQRVLAALATLPARRREVLVLRYYLGLSESEIADTLGISKGSVKAAAARGLAALAATLGKDSS